jgi:hypothetical protein
MLVFYVDQLTTALTYIQKILSCLLPIDTDQFHIHNRTTVNTYVHIHSTDQVSASTAYGTCQ